MRREPCVVNGEVIGYPVVASVNAPMAHQSAAPLVAAIESLPAVERGETYEVSYTVRVSRSSSAQRGDDRDDKTATLVAVLILILAVLVLLDGLAQAIKGVFAP